MRALVLALIFSASAHARVRDFTEVKTTHGPVLGRLGASAIGYLGIPYAQAPKGELRWKAPVSALAWKEPRASYRYGNPCPQVSPLLGRFIGDEDCLNLNVWKPKGQSEKPLPVMVFVHGGANSLGASNQEILGTNLYDGQYLAGHGPAIVVSFNYRLGLLGFMAHPELSRESGYGGSGNYALMDQLLALKWVQDNIAAFGGDPANVTVFGESAGAINIMALMASPLAKGLFSKAIIQSGFLTELPLAEAEKIGTEVSAKLGALSVLRSSVRAEDLVRFGQKSGVLQSFSATIDGYVLHSGVLENFEKGTYQKVPAIIGTTADEMVSLAPFVADSRTVVTDDDYEKRVRALFGDEVGGKVLAEYPSRGTANSPRRVFETMLTDSFTLCPTRRVSRAWQANGASVHKYVFSHPNDFSRRFGAFHGIELPYVFGTHLGTSREYALSKQVMSYWTSFAATGTPSAPGGPAWPRYSCESHLSRESYLSLDTPSTAAQGYRESKCDFWDSLGDVKINQL